MENKLIKDAVKKAVKKYGPEDTDKYSIMDCASNRYLDPDYSPFEYLATILSIYTQAVKMQEEYDARK